MEWRFVSSSMHLHGGADSVPLHATYMQYEGMSAHSDVQRAWRRRLREGFVQLLITLRNLMKL